MLPFADPRVKRLESGGAQRDQHQVVLVKSHGKPQPLPIAGTDVITHGGTVAVCCGHRRPHRRHHVQ